jgi:hypothetical protein
MKSDSGKNLIFFQNSQLSPQIGLRGRNFIDGGMMAYIPGFVNDWWLTPPEKRVALF